MIASSEEKIMVKRLAKINHKATLNQMKTE